MKIVAPVVAKPATTPAPTAAQKLADSMQWLTQASSDGQYVTAVTAVDDKTVQLTMQDPNALKDDMDPADREESNKWIADNAATILEPTINGVKLIAKTASGAVGESGYFSGDEQYWASNIPGVTDQAAEVWMDDNKNGKEEPNESWFLFPVASKSDAARIDPLIIPQINDLPVRFHVEP